MNELHTNDFFLLPNTTSIFQFCDQSIIKTIKMFYHHQTRSRIMNLLDKSKNVSLSYLAKNIHLIYTK